MGVWEGAIDVIYVSCMLGSGLTWSDWRSVCTALGIEISDVVFDISLPVLSLRWRIIGDGDFALFESPELLGVGISAESSAICKSDLRLSKSSAVSGNASGMPLLRRMQPSI